MFPAALRGRLSGAHSRLRSTSWPETARYPTSSRNTLTTPPINNWDITLAKHIALGERYRVEFLAQALNAFNHPEFVTGSPNQALQISDVGSQRNYFIPNAPNFFSPRQSFPSNARTLQLAMKFTF